MKKYKRNLFKACFLVNKQWQATQCNKQLHIFGVLRGTVYVYQIFFVGCMHTGSADGSRSSELFSISTLLLVMESCWKHKSECAGRSNLELNGEKKVRSEKHTDRDSKQEVDSTMPLNRDGGHYEVVLPKRKRKRKNRPPPLVSITWCQMVIRAVVVEGSTDKTTLRSTRGRQRELFRRLK